MPNFPPEFFPHFPPLVGCFAKSDSPHPSCATRMEQWRRRWILKDLTTFPPETCLKDLGPPKNDMFLFWPRHWHEEWVLIWLERQITPMNGLFIFVITVLWVNTLQFLGWKWSMNVFVMWELKMLLGTGPFDASWLADLSHSFFVKIFVLANARNVETSPAVLPISTKRMHSFQGGILIWTTWLNSGFSSYPKLPMSSFSNQKNTQQKTK